MEALLVQESPVYIRYLLYQPNLKHAYETSQLAYCENHVLARTS